MKATEAMGGLHDDGSSPPTIPSMGGVSINGEGNAALHQHDLGLTMPTMHVEKLKITREKERITARSLCKEAKATLGLSMTSSDVSDALTRLLHELRKSEVRLRLLNKKIEPFIDIDHLYEECATNIEYNDEVKHVMIRLYYLLKDRRGDTIEHCQIMETLHSSTNFNDFFAMTEQCFDPYDLETPAEHALFPETSPQSDFPSQTGLENATSSLSALDLETQSALLLRALRESAEMSKNKTSGRSSNLMTPEESRYGEFIKMESMDFEPGELKGQDKSQKEKVMHETEERDAGVFERCLKRIAAEPTRQPSLQMKVRGKHTLKKQKTPDICSRIVDVGGREDVESF